MKKRYEILVQSDGFCMNLGKDGKCFITRGVPFYNEKEKRFTNIKFEGTIAEVIDKMQEWTQYRYRG